MIYFPAAFLQGLILGALILTALAAATLLLMVLADYLRKQIW